MKIRKAIQNVEIWVILRVDVTQSYRKHVSILYCFQVIASYLSKVAYFNQPYLHLSLEFCLDLWYLKTRVPGWHCLSDSRVSRFDAILGPDFKTFLRSS